MNDSYSTEVFEKTYTYTGNDLGAVWSEEKTDFRVWAPTASAVSVQLYASGTDMTDDLIRSVPMIPAEKGTWTAEIPGNLNGIYYTYVVTVSGRTQEACDPYARTTGVNGKRAMVIDLKRTDPEGWAEDRDPHAGASFTDAVIYELHIRDLSIDTHSGIRSRGKYLGVIEAGTKTRSGQPTGLAHIKRLGITHLHLLPVYDFGSVDESSTKAQFNWGYDPVNYNVPEGSYSTDPFHGEVRVAEMKQMVKGLHDQGISVIMDVVYNHVYRTDEFCFNRIVPGYFSRFNANGVYSNGSCCGNDTASERSMVRKYIVDSVNYWADEYHIDGFRFDLVGLIDIDTINEVMGTVHRKHPNVVFYGEGWDMPTGITKHGVELTIQRNSTLVPGFAFFNDRIRDSIRGSVFDFRAKGFASGNPTGKGGISQCYHAAPGWTENPRQIINYVSCHDNHTLSDRIAVSMPGISREELAKRNLLAGACNLLCPGVPFFQAGEELLRSKTARNGEFVHNSYRSSDRVNSIKWANLNDPLIQKTVEYYQGLIAIRKAYPALRMKTHDEIVKNVSELECPDPLTAAFLMYGKNERILLAFNASIQPGDLELPAGNWEVLAENQTASLNPIRQISGKIKFSPLSSLVLVQKKG